MEPERSMSKRARDKPDGRCLPRRKAPHVHGAFGGAMLEIPVGPHAAATSDFVARSVPQRCIALQGMSRNSVDVVFVRADATGLPHGAGLFTIL